MSVVTTIEEMHYDFRLKCDRIDSLSQQDFNPAEIDWFLNEAQELVVKTKYNINNVYRAGLENTQKRIDDLSSILIKYPDQPDLEPTIEDGIAELELDRLKYPYLHLVRLSAYVNNCDWANLKFVQHDDLNDLLQDPFNKPSFSSIPYNFGKSSNSSGSSIYIYLGPFEIGPVRIEYLKIPRKMSLGIYTYLDGTSIPRTDSELPLHVRREVVDKAVMLAKTVTENGQSYQIALQKTTLNE